MFRTFLNPSYYMPAVYLFPLATIKTVSRPSGWGGGEQNHLNGESLFKENYILFVSPFYIFYLCDLEQGFTLLEP